MIFLHSTVQKKKSRCILKSSPAPAFQKRAHPWEDSNSQLA